MCSAANSASEPPLFSSRRLICVYPTPAALSREKRFDTPPEGLSECRAVTRSKKTRHACASCGAETEGKASLCFRCMSKEITLIDKADAAKVARQIKQRLGLAEPPVPSA